MKRLHPGLMLAGVGMSIAISVLMLFTAGVTRIIPISALCLFIASLQTWIPIREEHGLLFSVLTYVISGGVALVISRTVWTYLYLLLFGSYGFIRYILRRAIDDRFLTVLIRLLYLTALALAGLVFARLVLGLEPQEFLPALPPYIMAAALIIGFGAYIFLYRLCTLFFDSYLRSKLLPRR